MASTVSYESVWLLHLQLESSLIEMIRGYINEVQAVRTRQEYSVGSASGLVATFEELHRRIGIWREDVVKWRSRDLSTYSLVMHYR